MSWNGDDRRTTSADKSQEFAAFVRTLQAAGTAQQTMQKLVDLAPLTIPGCHYAGVSMVTGTRVDTPAATGDVPRQVDKIQYATGEGPCLDAIRDHEVFVSDDLATEGRWPHFSARAAAETGVRSMLSFRLFVDQDTLGSLNLYSKEIAAFGSESRASGAVFAAHAAVAVTTAREHDRAERLQHELTSSEGDVLDYAERAKASETLQRSMLTALPVVEHSELACRYVPAVPAAQLGGDWYDAFPLPDGNLALVVGDVAGHDIDAAVQMSQLRNIVRTVAVDRGEAPGEVLRRVDRIAQHLNVTDTATSVYAVAERAADGRTLIRYANAGHPPPLLITAAGHAYFLEDDDHLMLGVGLDLPRTSTTFELPAGATLLLYTDGLVERRGHAIAEGLDQLRALAGALAGEPVQRLCDKLIERFADGPDDDICLLALRTNRAHKG